MFADLSHPHVSLSLEGMLDISNFFTNDWQFAIKDVLSLVKMSSYSLLSRTTINFKKPVFWCQIQWPTRASINSSTKLFPCVLILSLTDWSIYQWISRWFYLTTANFNPLYPTLLHKVCMCVGTLTMNNSVICVILSSNWFLANLRSNLECGDLIVTHIL